MKQYSESGLQLTEEFEGLSLKSYRDIVGVLTIGYGHTGPDVHEGMFITQSAAEHLLLQDVQRIVFSLNRDLSIEVTQNEFDSLVDFAFNLGISALEHSTLWKLLNAGDFKGAASQFHRWDMAGGKVIQGLLRRRIAEQNRFDLP